MEEQKEHKRRVRYKGTHPRNYNEKYKELNPEKYQGTIEHVIQKGSTPAGMHIPILVDEILDFLKIEPGQNGLDATLGYGGHSSRMLACLQGKGHLCALDADSTRGLNAAQVRERVAAAKAVEHARVDAALDSSLQLGRNTLDYLLDQLAEKARNGAEELAGAGTAAEAARLNAALEAGLTGYTYLSDEPTQ